MVPSLRREIELLAFWFFILLLIGILFGEVFFVLTLGFGAYIGWTLYNLNKFTKWLAKPSKDIPETSGVWDESFYQLYHIYQRQRRARKKLGSIITRFKKSTQALPFATIVLDEQGVIEWFNPAAKTMFNLYTKADVGQRIDNLIRAPKFTRYLNKKKFNKPLELEYNLKTLLINITPYGSGQYLLSARDITLRIQIDEMRRDFISNASHELRTPLTVMSGYIEALMDSHDESLTMPLGKIQQQTQRMEQIVTELIGLAKLEASPVIEEPEEIDISKLLKDVYTEAQGFSKGNHVITLNSTPIKVHGKYDEIRMAISNLLTNAVRYTPEDGHIDLYTTEDHLGVCICVKDNGIGIDYEHIPRLTERFYRVDEGRSRDKGGTGLGLSIVKQVLERHGGFLKIETKPGEGSLFCCCFPHVH